MKAPSSSSPTSRQARYTAVSRVLWSVLLANLTVTVLKITLGAWSGALAVVADGFHSLVDSSSNLIGLAAIRLARRPADARHPYGYRRYETIGALAIGGMLLVAAYEISQAIVERWLHGAQPRITPLILGLVGFTFGINLLIFTLERRAGRRLESEILLADAAHTGADLYVTASVVASMVGVWLGWSWLDLLVAGGVVVLILRAAYHIARDAARSLTDAAAVDALQIEDIAREVPGVLHVHHVRSRGAPNAVFVDLHVKVHPGMSTEQAHAIASEVERQIKSQIANVVEALVHIEPSKIVTPTHWEQIAYDLRQIADGMGLGLHDLHVRTNSDGSHAIEMHLEMRGDISLQDAHTLAEEFEQRVQAQSHPTSSVITHLEPRPEKVLPHTPPQDASLSEEIRSALRGHVGEQNLLELQTYQHGEQIHVAVRLCLPGELTLAEAHRIAEKIERDLMLRFPQLHRLVVHVEPPEGKAAP